MIDFSEIPHDGDDWALFARDFLEEMGFYIETGPDRGPDGGKDMLVTEEVVGKLHRYRFRWLVSCKHFAHSGKAVSENEHERNILERVEAFSADGFIGVYSTVPSSGLNTRLKQLKETGKIRDYQLFDGRRIDNQLVTKGFSKITSRYFPESHKSTRPLHNVFDEYVALTCDECGKDLLEALYDDNFQAVVAEVQKYEDDGQCHVLDVYFACKGTCDKALEQICWQKYRTPTGWEDLTDLAKPNEYLRWVLATMNQLADGRHMYSQQTMKKERQLIMALAQKVFREVTEKERARFRELRDMGL
jgi:hypothetical protein